MLRRLIKGIQTLEDFLLTAILLMMLALACGQILLRNVFDSGLIWSDSLLRIAVLWVALIGAMVASRNANHINIDLVSRWLSAKHQWLANSLTALFTCIVCGAMAYHSFRFVQFEFLDGFTAFGAVPNWACQLILPLAFAVIALRYLAILAFSLRYKQPLDDQLTR